MGRPMHNKKLLNPLSLIFALLMLVSGAAAGQSEQEYLLPDDAFRPSAEAMTPDMISIRWDIADGYYLYRNKFRFTADNGDIRLGSPLFPPAEVKKDEFFGEVEIYRETVEVQIPISNRPAGLETLRLKTVVQGCADAGLCYPPHSQNLAIKLAPPDSPSNSGAAALQNLGKLSQELGLNDEDEILPADQAFQFVADIERSDQLRLQWKIAPGTYLYQDQIRIGLGDADGVSLGNYQLPKAKIKKGAVRPDGTIGDLAVYEQDFELPLPLLRSNRKATEITLQIAYQGCAEAGICYPPIRQKVPLALPAMAGDEPDPGALAQAEQAVTAQPQPTPVATQPGPTSEQDRIAATLAGGNTWLIILSFFGFGLLLALTPCVFPMIPILSGIIAGHGIKITTRRAFVLSLIYVLAMSATYTVAGVLAGLFGKNLQAAFQNPWVLSVFAGVFVLLALSMFGFYELQLPSRWQTKLSDASNRQRGGSFVGVAIMGFLSALIVGPCVAPPLAGALIYIGQTGDALLGGIGLFALAMGMGAPLLVIGTSAGKILPRAGSWMDTIKAVFGVGMLAVAILLLERIIPAAVAMGLWGTLLVVCAIYMGALQQLPVEASGWDRLWKGMGIIILIYGSLMLIGMAAGGRDTVQPLRGLGFVAGESAASELQFKRIKTLADLEREVATASAAGKPVMLDFYADWCVTCKEMERYTFSDQAVLSALSGFVLLQADVTANDEDDQALLQGHFGMPGPPSIMFYRRDGQEQKGYRVVGYMPAEEFAEHVRQAAAP